MKDSMATKEIDTISIKEAQVEDAEEIAYVQRDAWLETYPNEKLGITKEDIEDRYSNMPEKIKKWEQRISMKPKEKNILVAKDKDRVVGFSVLNKNEKESRLYALYIHPGSQGKKIGSKLILMALDLLGKEHDIVVEVANYNIEAISFYKKFGFEYTGEKLQDENFRLKSGAIIPEIKMVLKK